jgi:hypothetical protein
MADNRVMWPVLVRAGLVGLETRWAAVGFARVTAAVAVACLACGFEEETFFWVGGLLGLLAGWNFLCIWWVDANSRWSAHRLAVRRPGVQLLAGESGAVFADDLHRPSHPQA